MEDHKMLSIYMYIKSIWIKESKSLIDWTKGDARTFTLLNKICTCIYGR